MRIVAAWRITPEPQYTPEPPERREVTTEPWLAWAVGFTGRTREMPPERRIRIWRFFATYDRAAAFIGKLRALNTPAPPRRRPSRRQTLEGR